MNLYAYVHNDPLTHFDEYGLLDFGQFDDPIRHRQNQRQFERGLTSGAVDGLFGAAKFMNWATYGLGRGFGFNNQEAYSLRNTWLQQTQASFHTRYFSDVNTNAFHYKWGHFLGDFTAGSAVGGIAFKGIKAGASVFKTGEAWRVGSLTAGSYGTAKRTESLGKLAKTPMQMAKLGTKGSRNIEEFLKVGKFTYTDTAAKHFTEFVKRGPNTGRLSVSGK